MPIRIEPTLGVENAYEALDGYGRVYGELPLRLLLHVAVPQRIRPDFVNLAKVNFLPSEVAGDLSLDADVLFAPFVEATGVGYYRLDSEVRRQCLLLLDAAYAHQREFRSMRVADLLLAYLEHLEHQGAVALDALLEEYVAIERWVASAFLAPAETATRFAEALQRAAGFDLADRGLLVRFGPVASAITIPLAGHQGLLEYARGFDALVGGDEEEARRIFVGLGPEIRVAEIALAPPPGLAERPARREAEPSREMSTNQTLLQYAPAPRPLGKDESWNVFLSYRSVDRPLVMDLYAVLRSAGHKVFLDQDVLKAGDDLIRQLAKHLKGSQAGVLIWSTKSADSDWVRLEYETMEAMAGSKPGFCFVPVRVGNKEFPRFARNRVFLNFTAYPDGPNGGELLRLLHAVVGQPLSDASVRFAAELDQQTQAAANLIKAARMNGDAQRLRSLFEVSGLPWEISATLGCLAADAMFTIGEPQGGLEMLEQLERRFPRAIRPKQLRALALARIGGANNLAEAQEILGTLYSEGHRDPETVAIYARTFMDRYTTSGDVLMLRRSSDLYEDAFEHAADDYYTGIPRPRASSSGRQPTSRRQASWRIGSRGSSATSRSQATIG